MKSVAVIRAGPAGIAAAKALAEQGLQAVVFDGKSHLGGMWQDAQAAPQGPAWEGMRTNLSEHNCCFSDHSHPSDMQDFPTVPEMGKYLSWLCTTLRFGKKYQALN